MKNLKRKNLVLALLVLFALAVTGTSYAYWASSVAAPTLGVKTPDVVIGSGEAVTMNVTVNETNIDSKVLVPTDRVIDTLTQAASITVEFTVAWLSDSRLEGVADADISAVVSNIKVGGVANPYTLITVTPGTNPTTIAHEGTAVFTFVVTMDEPDNVTEYNAVAGKIITFDLTFTVTPRA